jgi:CheY-like chemotaxis protein
VAVVAQRAVEVLEVGACIFHYLRQEELETVALYSRPTFNAEGVARAASLIAPKVVGARLTIIANNLGGDFPNEGLPNMSGITSYLGVPLFSPDGLPLGVGAVLGEASRQFDENDEWWLSRAAKLVSDALAEAMKARPEAVVPPPPPPVVTAEGPSHGPADPGQPLLLVIDDDPSVNEMVCEVLKGEGYRVESAFDGQEGVKMFRPAEHALVITDLVMPRMNGWEVTAALRARAPHLPVVIITGYGSGTWNATFLREQGVAAVLHKPFDFNLLCNVIRSLTSRREHEAAHLAGGADSLKIGRVVW